MKLFIAFLITIGVSVSAILTWQYKYPIKVGIYHIIILASIIIGFFCAAYFIKYCFKKPNVPFILSNLLAGSLWLFLCLFYPIVIGSNHFWGNTMTFEILKNYLTSFDAILSVLPVEKWILVTLLVVYISVILVVFYFIRIKKTFFTDNSEKISRIPKKKIFLLTLGSLALVFAFIRPLLNLKRTMHFNQEPLLYFVFGPMWDTHTDQLLTTSHKNSTVDFACPDSIKQPLQKDKVAIIILLDALRSDHLPMYGYKKNTAPFLDSLYKSHQIIKVKNAFSTSTNTIGGVSGLFYSKGWAGFNYGSMSLMQYFKLSGYSTSAFLTGYHSGWYGLSAMYRGYCDNFYESTSAYHTAIDDDLVTLKKIKETPFTPGSFTFIHLLSTHPIGKRSENFRRFTPDKIGLNVDPKTALTNNYDNGILQGDFVINKIFNKLKEENLLDRTTLFIVGDHGDLLGEDGLYGHSGGLHEKLLEVPILIYDKDLAWYQETRFGSLQDIAPTLSDRLFQNIPLCWEGRSLHNPFPLPFTLNVSISTTNSDLAKGHIYFTKDTIKLNIFDNLSTLQKTAVKIDSVNWKTTYNK